MAWASHDGSELGIFARRYDASGTPRGDEFRVNASTVFIQRHPAVASSAAGAFVVAWQSYLDGDGNGVFAQRYDPAGALRGAEFRVNTVTTGYQMSASLAADAAGNFVVAWESAQLQFWRALGQRYGGLHPTALTVDAAAAGGSDGNGVFEPGETAPVRPGWRNSTGAAQSLGALASGFSGPAGATYTIVDATGNYTLADGAAGFCSDCYLLAVSDPAPRPALHWDGVFDETLLPEQVHGQRKPWTVHVGRSFADVSTTSPFYRFIETLLHRSVTGGCGPAQYCPANATTREQMAAFVLVAREGAGYVPPACGTPVFGDVPASNPFCRWIEELARRAVVTGCGGGNYCPGAAVSREQMAIFVLRTLDPALDPPECVAGSEMFGDVPAANPFCRWVEELARRGVVTGCGGGNYCPSSAVSREQMGVFLSVTFDLTLYGP